MVGQLAVTAGQAVAGSGGMSDTGKVLEKSAVTHLFEKGLTYNLLVSHILQLLSSAFIYAYIHWSN